MSEQPLDKSPKLFPVKNRYTFLNACGVGAAYAGGAHAQARFAELHAEYGSDIFYHPEVVGLFQTLRERVGRLLGGVSATEITFCKNLAEPTNQIALGYDWQPGDEVIIYSGEYPSNYYPWDELKRRGVVVKQIPDSAPDANFPETGKLRGWRADDLESLITNRTRIVAISHVQFTSGFAGDLNAIGEICKKHGVDFVVDAAQSLGAMPIDPQASNIACLIASGWKWLMGPIGCAVMYTRSDFRAKLKPVLLGPDMMEQGDAYLDRSFSPFRSGKFFEYSTNASSLAFALSRTLEEVHLRYGISAIYREILRLQDLFLANLKSDNIVPLLYQGVHRSGILSLHLKNTDLTKICPRLKEQRIICTVRGDYLRIAPHFYIDDETICEAARTLSKLVG